MTRIDTASLSLGAFADLQRSQQTLHDVARQTSSEKKAEDVKGYGRDAGWLVSSQRLLARIESRRENAVVLQFRFQVQDQALERAASAASDLRQSVLQAIALDDGSGLDQALERAFDTLSSAVNTKQDGRYLFGGVQDDLPPVGHIDLETFTADPATVFASDSRQQILNLDGVRRLPLGPLAPDVAAPAFASLEALVSLRDGPLGPLSGKLNADQKAALSSLVSGIKAAHDRILRVQADNGRAHREIEDASLRFDAEYDALKSAIGEVTGVDLAELATRLSQAQLSYQASASVFNNLRNLSLLDVL